MDKLTELEEKSHELLSAIRSKADAENRELPLPPLDITGSEPELSRRRIPSWIAVAAMITGIAIGFAMPDLKSIQKNSHTVYNFADTCRSIAQDDVNLSLLITSL